MSFQIEAHLFHSVHPHILCHCSYMYLVEHKYLHCDILGHIQLKKSKKQVNILYILKRMNTPISQ